MDASSDAVLSQALDFSALGDMPLDVKIFHPPTSGDFIHGNFNLSKFVPIKNYINLYSLVRVGRDELVEHAARKIDNYQRVQFTAFVTMGKR